MSNLFPRMTNVIRASRFSKTKQFIKYSFITGSIGLTISYGVYSYDPGFKRQCDFYIRAMPILIHYKYVEYKHEYIHESFISKYLTFLKPHQTLEDKYNVLHQKYAQKILDVILKLRGLYVKAGQFATSRPDIVPECWIDKLRMLQDGVPAQDMEYVRNVIESELNQPLESIFSVFDSKSLGAASIGQAHYAKLKASPQHGINEGMEVCVKLQYPEMEKVFGSDLKSIRMFVSLLEPAIADALQEMETQFLKEFDYIREADNLRTAFKNMEHVFAKEVVVPQPIDHLCTRNVLTMTYIPGEKLEIAIKKRLKDIYQMMKRNNDPNYNPKEDEHRDITLTDLRKEMFNNNYNKYRFTPNNSLKYYRWILTVRRYIFNAFAIVFNYGISWIFKPLCFGEYEKIPYIAYDVPIVNDPLRFIGTLLRVHGYQIFVNGAFNGDPHPGNILLMPDGRLGLIDYGQFKYLTKNEIYEISKLYMTLKDGDWQKITEQAIAMGVKTDKMDTEYIAKFTIFGWDRIDLEFREGKSTFQFISELAKRDKVRELPGNYYLIQRTVFLLRGLAALMQIDVSVADYWYPFAKQFLSTHDSEKIESQ